MYLPRNLISLLYNNLIQYRNSKSLKVLILAALEPDALCACRILTELFKRDNILHHIVPIAGYGDLARIGENEVQRMKAEGEGGTIICLGVGGLVDLGDILGLDPPGEDDATNGIEVWVIDARRPWNLGNVFGGFTPEQPLVEINDNARRRKLEIDFGEIKHGYRSGRGGVIVFDDGDISQELEAEREAYFKLDQMPEVEDDNVEDEDSGSESDASESGNPRKRKSWLDDDEENEDYDGSDEPPSRRRRNNSGESIPSSPSRPARRGLLTTNGDGLPTSFQAGSESPEPEEPPTEQEKPVSARKQRRLLLKMRRKHESILHAYYSLGITYSEPISSLLYSLASDLGRENNDALWNAIVGVSSLELYGRSITGINPPPSESNPFTGWGGDRAERIKQVFRDEVRRLNPPDQDSGNSEKARGHTNGTLQTRANSPNDTSIRLSPEPRLLLVRHWSLLDSMMHSPYLASRLHLWSDHGRRRLDKLLAKMGFSKKQCNQNYTHMDMDLKRSLRQSFLKYAPLYNLDALAPPVPVNGRGREGWGFVRSWGWTGCFSAVDVAVVIGAILEVGKTTAQARSHAANGTNGTNGTQTQDNDEEQARAEGDQYVQRFWDAYDALRDINSLKSALEPTKSLHRAIHRTGTAIFSKHQLRHLRAFRIAVVKDGPDLHLFNHPGALTKLALWVGEAVAEQERDKGGRATPLVLASLNERRGVYVVVGTGGRGLDFGSQAKDKDESRKAREQKREAKRKAREAKRAERKAAKAARRAEADDEDEDEEEASEEETESEESDAESDVEPTTTRNRFGNSFQEVVAETNARVRIESFDHCVVEVKKDDLGVFLEALSGKSVMS